MRERSLVFWDFDGVIKESVAVKSNAYERLFAGFGDDVRARVRAHHERNGGLSRFEKIPLYLSWAGQEASPVAVEKYCGMFSDAVMRAVIECDWVPGAREYLEANHTRQKFVVVTATPQAEIEEIVATLGIARWFREVHGSPLPKADAILASMRRLGARAEECLMIGDSDSDHSAAKQAGIAFLLRRTPLNQALQREYDGPQCEDFIDG